MVSIRHWVDGFGGAAIFAVVAWGIWRSWRIHPRPAEPRCATCGYALVGMASAHCPECGASPADAGIISARPTALDVRRLSLSTAVFFIASMLGCKFLNFHVATYYRVNADANVDYRLPLPEKPAGRHYRTPNFEARILMSAEGWSHTLAPQALHATYIGSSDRGTVDYDFARCRWTFSPGGGMFRNVSGVLQVRDIQDCFPADKIDPAIANDIRKFLSDAAALSDTTSLTHPLTLNPAVAFAGYEGGGSTAYLLSLSTGRYIPWLCLALWGLSLPYFGIWRGRRVTGPAALKHLSGFAVSPPFDRESEGTFNGARRGISGMSTQKEVITTDKPA